MSCRAFLNQLPPGRSDPFAAESRAATTPARTPLRSSGSRRVGRGPTTTTCSRRPLPSPIWPGRPSPRGMPPVLTASSTTSGIATPGAGHGRAIRACPDGAGSPAGRPTIVPAPPQGVVQCNLHGVVSRGSQGGRDAIRARLHRAGAEDPL